MPNTKEKPHPPRGSIYDEIKELDKKITGLLGRRTELLAKAASGRRSRKGKLADPRQEKELWAIWKDVRESQNLDNAIWERIFSLTNSLAYARTEQTRPEKGFNLFPKPAPLQLTFAGPPHLPATRGGLALAAMLGGSLRIPGAVLNDPLIELAKLLNQVEGKVSWDSEGITSESDGALAFDNRTIFCGQDPFNLFLALAMTLPVFGIVKLTGGTSLRNFDLSVLQRFLPAIGARMVHLDPHSAGLPVRIESSGVLPDEVHLPDWVPPSFVHAMLIGWTGHRKKTRFFWDGSRDEELFPGWLKDLLSRFGSRMHTRGGHLEISGFDLHAPKLLSLPMDPVATGYALGLPAGRGGFVKAEGIWPDTDEGAKILEKLRAFLTVEASPEGIQARFRNMVASNSVAFTPLSFALAVISGRETLLEITGDDQDLEFALETGEVLGLDLARLPGEFKVGRTSRSQPAGTPPTIHAPTPEWAMALALISTFRPGFTLSNPGIVSSLWPQFWNIYNETPLIPGGTQKRETNDTPHVPKQRKRIESKDH
ncbi:MAG: chorismate mutase [Desulfovibrionales bacterium]